LEGKAGFTDIRGKKKKTNVINMGNWDIASENVLKGKGKKAISPYDL
jgi:hypothetical protein